MSQYEAELDFVFSVCVRAKGGAPYQFTPQIIKVPQ